MQYLTLDDVLRINEAVMARERQQSLLREQGSLEGAYNRPQWAALYEDADLARQATLLVSGIALAHAFVDGNKRTAITAGHIFLALNGHRLVYEGLAFADAVLALVNHPDSVEAATERLEAWIRERLHSSV
jgi:death-on-curing protein